VAGSTQSELSPVHASFAARVEAFYQSLPREEQELLEQVLALARSANGAGSDVQGFIAQPLGSLALLEQIQIPSPMGLAGAKLKPKG